MYDRILLSLDGTSDAEAALPEVEKLLRVQPATVILVRVGPAASMAVAAQSLNRNGALSDELLSEEYALLSNAAEMEIRRYLDTVGARLEQLGATIIPEVSFNNPAEDILLFAKHYSADLIVMATHGRSGISRLLHGSVTENVLEHTHCPMLIVHVQPPDHATQPAVGVASSNVAGK